MSLRTAGINLSNGTGYPRGSAGRAPFAIDFNRTSQGALLRSSRSDGMISMSKSTRRSSQRAVVSSSDSPPAKGLPGERE